MLRKNEFRKGVASFYIVAISTLVLVIISASFAAVIISELARTSNNDLAQSAYDSAMAGVEDAKLAYYNYIKCRESGESAGSLDVGDGVVKCSEIMQYIENEQDCYTVAHVLGRISQNESGEVLIKETSEGDNKMKQAYTCVKINKNPSKYSISAGEGVTTSVAKVGLEGSAEDVESLKIELEKEEGSPLPVIALGVIQTTESFTLEEFDMTRNGQTNRGMVFLVPYTDESELQGEGGEYIKAYDEQKQQNIISTIRDGKEDGFLKSNNKMPDNRPYAVYCGGLEAGAKCEVTIDLPRPVGWEEGKNKRSNDTFMITRTTYGKVQMAIEFCAESTGEGSCDEGDEVSGETTSHLIPTSGMQVVVDSTGKANDLFRRVEAVLEDTSAVSGMSLGLYNAVQADNIYKIESALCEAKFINPSNCAQ